MKVSINSQIICLKPGEYENWVFFITGIKIQNEQIPSGVYSALERANLTDSVLKSYNDVNLRWIAKENWKYSLNFDGNTFCHFSDSILCTFD